MSNTIQFTLPDTYSDIKVDLYRYENETFSHIYETCTYLPNSGRVKIEVSWSQIFTALHFGIHDTPICTSCLSTWGSVEITPSQRNNLSLLSTQELSLNQIANRYLELTQLKLENSAFYSTLLKIYKDLQLLSDKNLKTSKNFTSDLFSIYDLNIAKNINDLAIEVKYKLLKSPDGLKNYITYYYFQYAADLHPEIMNFINQFDLTLLSNALNRDQFKNLITNTMVYWSDDIFLSKKERKNRTLLQLYSHFTWPTIINKRVLNKKILSLINLLEKILKDLEENSEDNYSLFLIDSQNDIIKTDPTINIIPLLNTGIKSLTSSKTAYILPQFYQGLVKFSNLGYYDLSTSVKYDEKEMDIDTIKLYLDLWEPGTDNLFNHAIYLKRAIPYLKL